jgi:hypothetical protein
LTGAAATALCAVLTSAALPGLACEVPDEGTNTPWRRVVSKVRYAPEIETWAQAQTREGALVQYVVLLDAPRQLEGKCWWPVEVRAEGKTWRRFLVTPDGMAMREDRGS